MHYLFKRGLPAIFFEIYLPKKSAFQEPLYNALTEGRDPEVVQHYLTDHATDIQEMLSRDWPELGQAFTPSLIEKCAANIPNVFVGYSIYEVDGVYFNPGSKAPIEERSQVIRIFFVYEIHEDWPDEFASEIKRFLRSSETDLEHYPNQDSEIQTGFAEVEEWKQHIAVFLIGFVIHRIIRAIQKNPDLRQDEIWLTSFWNAIVNRFIPA